MGKQETTTTTAITDENPFLATMRKQREAVTGSADSKRTEARREAEVKKAERVAKNKAQRERMQAKRAEQREAEVQQSKQTVYVPGDGLTHATGKTRLGVERGDGCVCGCGQMPEKKRSRFVPGHDARMYKLAKAIRLHRAGEGEQPKFDDRQRAYLEGRNLI